MRQHKFIKPRKGLIVRNPINFEIMPEKGMEVPWFGVEGTFYKRRVKCGDCAIVTNKKTILKKDKE
jgi:hypothetical protein